MSVRTVWVLIFTSDYENYVTIHNTYDAAKKLLLGIVEDNWDPDALECEFGNMDPDQAIELYFDFIPENSWEIQKKPIESAEEDLFLTPGMCSVIKKALEGFSYEEAGKILEEHGEAGEGTHHGAGVEAINRMIENI